MVLQWFSLVFEWFPLVLYLFPLVFQWFPLVFSTHIYGFIGSIMGFLGSRLVSIGFVRNLARCHCSGPLLPPYPPLLRVIRRSGPRWPPLGHSFLSMPSISRKERRRGRRGPEETREDQISLLRVREGPERSRSPDYTYEEN